MSNGLSIPNNETSEITLLGTGGGYGESIVIHLGGQNWIVVDSCINPNTKECLPLEYLKKIGVNISSDVKLIICSHWHDDHILGLSLLLDACQSAKFVITRTSDRKKFLQLLSLDYKKLEKESTNSSTIELNRCLEIIQKRGTSISEASNGKIIYTVQQPDFSSQVIALSPSDYSIELFNTEISTLLTEFGPTNRRIVCNTPNSKCIVLYFKLGEHRALLGSDLETNTDNRLGWANIIEFNSPIDKRSSLYKAAHHGSRNGNDERIWTQLLVNNPVTILSPYNKGTMLPKNDMIELMKMKSDKIYLTSNPVISEKPKKRDPEFEKLLITFKQRLKEVRFRNGIINCRISLMDINDTWKISLLDNAYKL
jgi:beta-lactamase superfamily II metal-dependent hydrolase